MDEEESPKSSTKAEQHKQARKRAYAFAKERKKEWLAARRETSSTPSADDERLRDMKERAKEQRRLAYEHSKARKKEIAEKIKQAKADAKAAAKSARQKKLFESMLTSSKLPGSKSGSKTASSPDAAPVRAGLEPKSSKSKSPISPSRETSEWEAPMPKQSDAELWATLRTGNGGRPTLKLLQGGVNEAKATAPDK